MRKIILIIFNVIYNSLFIILLVCGVIGFLCEFLGIGTFERIFKNIGIVNIYNIFVITFCIVLPLFIIASIIKSKFFK